MPAEFITDGGFLASNNDENSLLNNAWIPATNTVHNDHLDLLLTANGFGYNDNVFMAGSTSYLISLFGSLNPSQIASNYGGGEQAFTCLLLGNKLSVVLSGRQFEDGNGDYNIESSSTFNITSVKSLELSINASVIHDSLNNLQNILGLEPSVKIVLEKIGGTVADRISKTISFNNNFDDAVYTNTWILNAVPTGSYRVIINFNIDDLYYAGTRWSAHRINLDNISLKDVTAVPVIHDIEMNEASIIDFTGEASAFVVPNEPPPTNFNVPLASPWSIWSCPLNITTLTITHEYHPSKQLGDIACEADGTYTMEDFVKNHLFEELTDDKPVWYKYGGTAAGMGEFMDIVKNNSAQVYWPEFGFNGIGDVKQFQGYQMRIKAGKSGYFKWSGVPLYSVTDGVPTSEVLVEIGLGWNLIAFPSLTEAAPDDFFATLLALGTNTGGIQIVKNNSAQVFWPEYNFNSIGNLQPGQGYQVRVYT